MKYLIKPTRNGWYVTARNCWKHWSIRGGWFIPLELMWCMEDQKYYSPSYIFIAVLGFGVELGKFEGGGKR